MAVELESEMGLILKFGETFEVKAKVFVKKNNVSSVLR